MYHVLFPSTIAEFDSLESPSVFNKHNWTYLKVGSSSFLHHCTNSCWLVRFLTKKMIVLPSEAGEEKHLAVVMMIFDALLEEKCDKPFGFTCTSLVIV